MKNAEMKGTVLLAILAIFAMLLLQACSFQLRESVSLSVDFQTLQIVSESQENGLVKAIETAVEEAGGKRVSQSNTKIKLSKIREGRRVVAYTNERKARIYLLYLKLNYDITISKNTGNLKNNAFPTQRINLDKTFVYDANFALGKAEEEKQIREQLYAEAARLILLRLKYHE